MNGKLRTKILGIVIALIISALLSIAISWVILQIFTKQPQEILNITVLKIFEIFQLEEGIQIFILTLLCFILLIAVSVWKIFNLDDYLSKTYKVTKEIRIPLPVGKEQYQNGSSWWLSKKEFSKKFGVNVFDPQNHTISQLLKFAEKERKREENLMKNPDLIIPGKSNIENTVDPIFKSGGLVVGKKDKYKYSPYIKKFKGKIPYISLGKQKVEEIYYIKDDMHSLTLGATRSRKDSLFSFTKYREYRLSRRKFNCFRSKTVNFMNILQKI